MVVFSLNFIDHLSPLLKVATDILAQGISPDDVPPAPENIVTQIHMLSDANTGWTVFLLPSPEFCEWLGALSRAAEKRMTKRSRP